MSDARQTDGKEPPVAAVWAWIAVPIVGAAIGGVAVFVQRWFAPVGLFPILIGLVVGGGLLLPLNWIRPRRMRTLVAAATLATIGCASIYHLGTFAAARHAAREEAAKLAEMFAALEKQGLPPVAEPPPTLAEYFRRQWETGRPLGKVRLRGTWLGLWWTLDAVLVGLAAAVLTASVYVDRTKPRRAEPSPDERASEVAS